MGRDMRTATTMKRISRRRNICLPAWRERPSTNPGKTHAKRSCESSCVACGVINTTIDMITWTCKTFTELTPDELYAILRLRSEVFVVEQNCVFLDIDNKDQKCHHLMGWRAGKLVGYSRLLGSGISYVESSIGRVVTSPAARGFGVG